MRPVKVEPRPFGFDRVVLQAQEGKRGGRKTREAEEGIEGEKKEVGKRKRKKSKID